MLTCLQTLTKKQIEKNNLYVTFPLRKFLFYHVLFISVPKLTKYLMTLKRGKHPLTTTSLP